MRVKEREKSQATGPHALFLHGEKGDLGCQCLCVLHVLCILPLCDDKRQRGGPDAGLWGAAKRRGGELVHLYGGEHGAAFQN